MAVSTADFYTYAKETGTPLAQSNEERAVLYPAVNQWKRSRLNTPRPESNDTGALETAAVLGGIVGAGLLGRRYLKNRPPTATKTPDIVEKGGAGVRTDYTQPKTWDEVKQKQTPKYKTTETVEKPVDSRGVQTVDIEVVQPDGQVIPTEVPSAPAPVKSPKEFSVYDYLVDTKTVDPQRQYVIDRISDPERVLSSLADEQLDIIRGTSPRGGSAIENAERTAELRRQVSLVNKNRIEAADQVRKEIVSDQSINALGSAEDQQTGRVNRQLQRNEDLDQSQIAVMEEIAEEQDRRFGRGLESGEIAPGKEYGAPIDTVTQSLPDGPPVIQSEQRVGVSNRRTAQELLDQTKGEIIRVEGPQGQVRYAETRPDPSWVGAKSDIPTNQPDLGPNLAESPVGQRIATARNEIIKEQKAMGVKRPKPSIIETELSRQLGKQSNEYGGSYTNLKNKIKLGVEDPRFLTDLDQDTKYVGGVELPIAVRNVFDNTATGSRQLKEPYIKPELAQKADMDLRNEIDSINNYWGNAKLEVYQELNPLIKQTDALLEEQNMLLYSLNNQGPNRELGERLGLVSKEINTNQNNITYLENRLSGIEKTQTNQLKNTEKWVPKTLTDWKGEGTVVRPKPQLSRNKEFITDEGDSLSSLNQATQRVTEVGPEDLEIVPGGLLTGGYPKGVLNIASNVQTGTPQTPIKLASGTSIRGMGGTDLDNTYVPLIEKGTAGNFVSKYIGKDERGKPKERILTQGGNILPNTPEAGTPTTIVEPEPIQRASGGFYQNPQYQEARPKQFIKEATPNSREALQLTDTLRKIQTDQSISPEARKEKAQDFLAKIMSNRGISGASGTFSPLR